METALRFFKYEWSYRDFTIKVFATPFPYQKSVPLNQDICIDLTSSEVLINQASLYLSINGYDITQACSVFPISNGFRMIYHPLMNWYYNETKTIVVRAADVRGMYMPDYIYNFYTVRKRISSSINYVINKLSNQIDWGDLK